jgi:hypothetical protein
LFKDKNGAADVSIGSGNLTAGGLWTNHEAGVVLHLESASDTLRAIDSALESWSDESSGITERLTPKFLQRLVEKGYVSSTSEEESAASRVKAKRPGETLFASIVGSPAPPLDPDESKVSSLNTSTRTRKKNRNRGRKSSDWVVNTDSQWRPKAWKDMFNRNCVSAFFDSKERINGIQEGDRVFLYQNRRGVIAMGTAADSFKVRDYEGRPREEHYVPVDFEFKYDPFLEAEYCVSATEINATFGGRTLFNPRGTAFRILEPRVARAIAELLRRKLPRDIG